MNYHAPKLIATLVALTCTLSIAQAQFSITNGSFEADGTGSNSQAISSWYEAHQVGGTASLDSAEQALFYDSTVVDGNIPATTSGTMWGHFIDRGLSANEAIYQNIGTWNTGDSTQYLLTALLGDRSNQTFEDMTIELWSVDAGDSGTPADGSTFASAFSTELLLASSLATMTDGGASTATANYSDTITLNASNLEDGDSVWIRIAQTGTGNGHSLIDNVQIVAVPEASSQALLTALAILGLGLYIRRRRS